MCSVVAPFKCLRVENHKKSKENDWQPRTWHSMHYGVIAGPGPQAHTGLVWAQTGKNTSNWSPKQNQIRSMVEKWPND